VTTSLDDAIQETLARLPWVARLRQSRRTALAAALVDLWGSKVGQWH
jgi:hypothetical protein